MDPILNPLIALLIFGGSQQRTANIIRRTFPVALPGSSGQRFLLAALVADRDVRRQEAADTKIIQEVVDKDQITDDQALKAKFPLLHEVFVKLPAGSIVFPAAAPPAPVGTP
jgi:hypothetical protein